MESQTDERGDRELDMRAGEKRDIHWQPPQMLPSPNPQEGYGFRWVRVSSLGQVDAANVSSILRQGWTVCKAADYPEITIVGIENETFKDNIVIGGLMLCKAPQQLIDEHNDYYKHQTARQMESVDNTLMKESDERMPLFNERKTTTTFGPERKKSAED